MKLKVLLLLLLSVFATAQTTVVDSDINPGDQVTWTSATEYILDGLVFVESGATLTIEAGVLIRGKSQPTTGDNTSALIIARGAQVFINGAAQAPVVMTAESDDLNDPFDLLPSDRGLWGGLIVLGDAVINTTDGEDNIEGIDPNEPRGVYGGSNDADNSGEIHYLSLRHGGAELAPGDEINGLTLGAVGSGTVIDHVEIYANLDDGVEWFGGTVNIKYLVSAFNADDGVDWDQGFRGKGQYWFVLQGADNAGRSAEQDGGADPEDGTPYSMPVIANATFVGPGLAAFPQGDGGQQLIFRDNSGGKYFNSIFTDYNGGQGGDGITIEDLNSGEDSRARLEAGQLLLKNNIWFAFGSGNTLNDFAPQQFVADSLAANNNLVADPQLNNIVRDQGGGLDARPAGNSPAASGAITLTDNWFDNVDYYGAFDPNAPQWIRGWTALAREGLLGVEEQIVNNGIPHKFTIRQNYPNPFNPSTRIEYSLPRAAQVQLTVFNVQGRKVATLVNDYRAAGNYAVTWNAENLSGGVYFYRFQAGNSVETRKMILLK